MSLCELLQVPFTIEDPDYKGLELDVMSPCEKHGMASERLVAFEGTDTGRRFFNMCTAGMDCRHSDFFLTLSVPY